MFLSGFTRLQLPVRFFNGKIHFFTPSQKKLYSSTSSFVDVIVSLQRALKDAVYMHKLNPVKLRNFEFLSVSLYTEHHSCILI